MFAGPAAGGLGGTPGPGQTSSRNWGALRGGIGSCQGVRERAVSIHCTISMHARCDFQLILPRRLQLGAGGLIASVFPCPAAAAGHWPAAAATKPTGPPSPRGTPIGSFWGRSGKPHAPAASDLSVSTGPPAGGERPEISGSLRTANRTPAAQTCMPREAEA